ncbi:hypothetical protein TIFTF001_053976 [Ficus carica]|uniref:Uncharacterized protein n=1 Tax=Ficus carica TaxID=3494 RepID=A0AA88EI61_FICCA|nr:hypothetical protein TIFTF001_053976 [Ficus carica]
MTGSKSGCIGGGRGAHDKRLVVPRWHGGNHGCLATTTISHPPPLSGRDLRNYEQFAKMA